MKSIGMIGGMSWESTRVYYDIVNREVQERLGGAHSAKVLLYSFDFDDISELQRLGHWAEATQRMVDAALALKRAGADFLMICCNTMHLMADAVEEASGLPLLHIADPLGRKIHEGGLSRVGLIGSVFTMEDDGIVKSRLRERHGIETIVPSGKDGVDIDRVIVEELVCGKFLASSRARYREIMAELVEMGAQGIILGCTEIPLLVKPEDSAVPLYDTTALHAVAAVDWALAG